MKMMKMALTVKDLKQLMAQLEDDAPVAVIPGDEYHDKRYRLDAYSSVDGELVIQLWDLEGFLDD